jgi:methyltransferase-like protein/SAM-dependent methyltransferase
MQYQNLVQHYNEQPYESYAFPNSRPSHISTVSNLIGFKSISCENARVLEIGCASGGNIIPMAAHNPNAEFIAFDITQTQIDLANQKVEELGLKNIKFLCLDLNELPDLGKFDYIIAHGVHSWIPKELQPVLMKQIKNLLSTQGLAYVSYNTFPGWHYQQVVRNAMLFAGKEKNSATEKQDAGEFMLKILKSTNNNTPHYGDLMKATLDLIDDSELGKHSYYIGHEYLDTFNNPTYFTDFIASANENNLSYVTDAQIHSMFHPLSQDTLHDLYKIIGNDRIKYEQSLDFIKNRSFRQSIIAHSDACHDITGVIQNDEIANLYFCGKFSYVNTDIHGNKIYEYTDITGNRRNFNAVIEFSDIVYEYINSQYPRFVAYSELEQHICSKNNLKYIDEETNQKLIYSLLLLIQGNFSEYSNFPPSLVPISSKPKVDDYIRMVIKYQAVCLATPCNYNMRTGPLDRATISLLDGSRTIDEVYAILEPKADSFNLTLIGNEKTAQEALRNRLQYCLNRYELHGILI